MPLYVWRCPNCDYEVEMLQKMHVKTPPICAKCRLTMSQVITAAMVPPSRVQE